jgi:hypothetical protein
MKTTVDLPDKLLIEAKKRAAEERRPLRNLLIDGLRAELGRVKARSRTAGRRRQLRWVTVEGGLPAVDIADRERMHDWLRRQR